MSILNLDASWSSSSILLHMLMKLVSSSEGCRGRHVSIFMIKVHVCAHLDKAGVELRTLIWKLVLKKVKVVNIGDEMYNGVTYERSISIGAEWNLLGHDH